MASYDITVANWNAAVFWSNISQAGSGHTLDFSELPSSYSLDLDLEAGHLSISNGTTTFTVGDASASGSFDALLGGSTRFSFFDTIYGSQGNDTITGTAGDEEIRGEGGNDEIDGGGGEDTLHYGTGTDTIEGGDGNDYIDNGPWGTQSGPNQVNSGSGDDTVYAGDGDDSLRGEDGADRLYGEGGSDTIDGGAGNDRLAGDGGTDRFVFRDGYGTDIIEDFDRSSEVVDVASVGITSFSDIQSRLSNNWDGDAVLSLDDGSRLTFWDVSSSQLRASNFNILAPVCFVTGTAILTPSGEVPVEALRVGDFVVTADHAAQPIRWIGREELVFGRTTHRHKPIMFRAGCLGHGLPRRALAVSPQHRFLISEDFGTDAPLSRGPTQRLAAAKGMLDLPGVRQMRGKRRVEYTSLLFGRHEIIFAEGYPVESLFPGPNALRMVGAERRREIAQIIAQCPDPTTPDGCWSPARPVLDRRQAQQLITGVSCASHRKARHALSSVSTAERGGVRPTM